MERGVVVGGLMICGSFLLAASLNRSAVKEIPRVEPPAAEAQIDSQLPSVNAGDPTPAACNDGSSGTHGPAAGDAPAEGDLPGNGREACSQ